MLTKKPGIFKDFIEQITSQNFTLEEALSVDFAIYINYGIAGILMPACLARLPWPIRIVAWAIFAVFWLTIAWWLTIAFELVVGVPNMIIQTIRDEGGDFHNANGNWKPGACCGILKTIVESFGLILICGLGRIVFCVRALTDSFDQKLYGDCNSSMPA